MNPATQQLLIFLLGAAALHGLYLCVLLLIKPQRAPESVLIALILFCVSLYLANYLLFLTGLIRHFPHLLGLFYPWILLVGALYLLLANKMIVPDRKWQIWELVYFLPFIWGWFRIRSLIALPLDLKRDFIEWLLGPEQSFSLENVVQGNAHIILLACFAGLALQMAKRALQSTSAFWIRQFSSLLLFGLTVDLALKVIFVLMHWPGAVLEYVLAGLLALLLHLLGYLGIGKLEKTRTVLPAGAGQKYKTSPLTQRQLEDGRQALLDLMQREALYLRPELKIADVAAHLGMPSHHLSEVLNQSVGQHFSDFINTYRVEEAKAQLGNIRYRHLSVESLGLDCGFANKATFYRAFKKITGMTPGEWQNTISTNEPH